MLCLLKSEYPEGNWVEIDGNICDMNLLTESDLNDRLEFKLLKSKEKADLKAKQLAIKNKKSKKLAMKREKCCIENKLSFIPTQILNKKVKNF